MVASEGQHWYDRQGNPVYEVPRAKGDGMRPTTLSDARKLRLVPGFTTIARVASRPGLEAWKLKQILLASLTLPREEGELEDAYAERVLIDAQEQSRAAQDRGTSLHKAIELSIAGEPFDQEWLNHVTLIRGVLAQAGIEWQGTAEKTFTHPLGYGGKCDLSWPAPGLLDFKTTNRIDHSKRLAWDEHMMQLGAYSMGIFGTCNVRALNVFIGVEDKQVILYDWTPQDLKRGFAMFSCLLDFWYLRTELER